MPTRSDAVSLLEEWVESEALRRHMYAVEAESAEEKATPSRPEATGLDGVSGQDFQEGGAGREGAGRPLGRITPSAALLTFALAGCEGAAPEGLLSVRDSAGVRITKSDVAGGGASTVCSLGEIPDVRLTSPGTGEWTLFDVEDVDRLEDGRLVVLNRGAGQLLMFGRDGEFLGSIGQWGEGPGEFVDPIEFDIIAGDSIIVWDWELGRFVLFRPDGSPGRTVRLQPPVPIPTGRIGMLGRRGIAVGNHDLRPFDTELTPQFLQVLRYAWSGTLVDTLATLPYGERGLVDPESRMMGGPLFDSRGVFATHGNLLYTSDGSSPEVRIHRGKRLESIVQWEPGDLSVRKDDVEAYRAAKLERAENWAPLIRRRLDAFPAKDAFPAVAEIQIGDQGRIWIQTFTRPDAATTVWLGFAETGVFVCSLPVPVAFTVFHFDSGSVAGILRDGMDVESIEARSFTLPKG